MKLENQLNKGVVLASKKTDYDLCNDVLYKLCKENFEHDQANKILVKTIIIGRTYSVALERGKNKNKTISLIKKDNLINDDFYQFVVVPLFKNLNIDDRLLKLRNCKNLEDNHLEILSLQCDLMNQLICLNGEHKRSFASKYLHFHLPNLYFIYDSRASQALNKIVSGKAEKENMMHKKIDDRYVNFFQKSLFLQKEIKQQFSTNLTPRQLDTYLLKFANEHLRKKNNKKKKSLKKLGTN